MDTPVRAMIERGRRCSNAAVAARAGGHARRRGRRLLRGPARGLAEAARCRRRHIVWVDQPYDRVLAVMPPMYDDMWTAAKGIYKIEPVGRRWRGSHHLRAPRQRGQLRPRQDDRRDRLPLPRLFPVAVGSLPAIPGRDPRPLDHVGLARMTRAARRRRESRSRSQPVSRASGASHNWATSSIRPASIRARGPRPGEARSLIVSPAGEQLYRLKPPA